jgi:hypothetical protein
MLVAQAGIQPAWLSVLTELRGTLNSSPAISALLSNQAAHCGFDALCDF